MKHINCLLVICHKSLADSMLVVVVVVVVMVMVGGHQDNGGGDRNIRFTNFDIKIEKIMCRDVIFKFSFKRRK